MHIQGEDYSNLRAGSLFFESNPQPVKSEISLKKRPESHFSRGFAAGTLATQTWACSSYCQIQKASSLNIVHPYISILIKNWIIG